MRGRASLPNSVDSPHGAADNSPQARVTTTGIHKELAMEFSRPTGYLDKLLFAQRVVKAAQYRNDQKQALRELFEAMTELINALVDREQGTEPPPDAGSSEQPPAP
jgi:hypothetical protein